MNLSSVHPTNLHMQNVYLPLKDMLMKSYQLSPTQIQTLVPHMGSCIASGMITVQGLKVAYMYREEVQSSEESGWVFLSGEEGDDYIEDPENLGLYEVNVIANYDADIIAHLNAPAGSHFARNEQGVFERIDFEAMDLE